MGPRPILYFCHMRKIRGEVSEKGQGQWHRQQRRR